MNVVPEMGSSEDAECPVTLEEFTEAGDQQPLKMPRCGHTYSRKGMSMLLCQARSLQAQASGKKGRACQIQCPTCRLYSRMKDVNECEVDQEVITLLRKQAADRASKKQRFKQPRDGDGLGAVASDFSEYTNQSCGGDISGAESCPIPEIVKRSRSINLSEGQRHEKRQLLFGEVRRAVHKVVKHLVCDDDVEDTCHSLTDYILTNPTDDVLDFLTTPLIAFEVLHATWSVFEGEMYDAADQIGDAALRHHIAMLHALPPEGVPTDPGDTWAAHKQSLRTLLGFLLAACCDDLFPGLPVAAIKSMAALIIDQGLQICPTREEEYSHIWLQPQHFCKLAAAGMRASVQSCRLDTQGILPHGPPDRLAPLIDGLAEKARALLRPVYGDAAAAQFAHRAAALIATNAADTDSALVLMHGGPDLRAVVEDVVEALVLSGTVDSGGGGPLRHGHRQVAATCIQPPAALAPPPAAESSSACARSRDIARYVREEYEASRVRGEHSGSAPSRTHIGPSMAAPGPPPPAGYGNEAASSAESGFVAGAGGEGGHPSSGAGRGSRIPHITIEDLFPGTASAARVTLDSVREAARPSAAADGYRVPPPAPIHNRPPLPAAPPAGAGGSHDGGFSGIPDTAMYFPVDETSGTQMVLPERRGRALCSHFQKYGWCELGMHCALAHPNGRSVRFNLLGYPIRPGQKVCKFFMERARCKFGKNCKFNHPNIAFKFGPQTGSMVTRETQPQ